MSAINPGEFRVPLSLYEIPERISTPTCHKCGGEAPAGSEFCPWCGKKLTSARSRRSRGNGQGSVFKLKSGKYRAEVVIGWREDGRKITRSQTFKTKREAVNALPGLMAAREKKAATMAEYHRQWVDANQADWSYKTVKAYESAWHALELIASRRADLVSLADLQTVFDSHSARSASYLNNMRVVLHGVYKYAQIDDAVTRDLADFVVLRGAEPKKDRDAFRADEKARMWESWRGGESFAGYPLIMIYTGMRVQELLNTARANIDLEARLITGVGVKTENSKESPIFIAEAIVPVITELLAQNGDRLCPFKYFTFRRRFNEFCGEIGVRVLPIHCCRHTCATDLAEANVPPTIIQQIMRHTSYKTTLIYTHISAAPILDALDAAHKP